jgi:hypothetical protein
LCIITLGGSEVNARQSLLVAKAMLWDRVNLQDLETCMLIFFQSLTLIELYQLAQTNLDLSHFNLLAMTYDPEETTVYFSEGADKSIHSVFINSTNRQRLIYLGQSEYLKLYSLLHLLKNSHNLIFFIF